MKSLKLRYRNLETEVFRQLRDKIEASKIESAHFSGKCIKINVFDYTELAIVNDELMFLDNKGLFYSIWNGDCTIEDLIDILDSND